MGSTHTLDTMAWKDFFKIWAYVCSEPPPNPKMSEICGPFVHMPDAVPDPTAVDVTQKGKPIGDGTPLEPERG